MGLSGAGKTTLALELRANIDAVMVNGDLVRADLCSDLTFSLEDRIEHARRIGAIARLLADQGHNVIVDFICPTEATRAAFGERDLTVWVDRLDNGYFEDTNRLWEVPTVDIIIQDGTVAESAARVLKALEA